MALTLAELVKRELAPWDAVRECFANSLQGLPDMKSFGFTLQVGALCAEDRRTSLRCDGALPACPPIDVR